MTVLLATAACHAAIPFQFSIPEEKIVREIPMKDRDFAYINPNDPSTYIYFEEADYYRDYQRSYYAITRKKGGWDCMRHYEILANGCIPYFIGLEGCNNQTMHLLPKNLILEAMHIEGVSYLSIDHKRFNVQKYYEILNKLLEYTREKLTTRSMAQYLLDSMNYKGTGKILYLSDDPSPDYLRCLTLSGLKQLLGDRVVDVPKIEHIYKSYSGDIKQLYGKGFTYTRIVDDLPVDRENIEARIRNKEFDLVIFGSVHRGLRYVEAVRQSYFPNKIAYLCGEDAHHCPHRHLQNLFLREFN